MIGCSGASTSRSFTLVTMTRIIAGTARSLRLAVPPNGTRPTSDRVREAIFSSLDSWNMLIGSRVLDLFAGSGALGLESMSRGAIEAVLIERHGPAAHILAKNAQLVLKALEKSSENPPAVRIQTSKQSALTFLEEQPPRAAWDVVFIDPPYDYPDSSLTSVLSFLPPLLKDDAVVLVERSSRAPEPSWPAGMKLLRSKRYGETTLWWAEPAETNVGTDSS